MRNQRDQDKRADPKKLVTRSRDHRLAPFLTPFQVLDFAEF
jgi:hypothetical protein